MSVDRLIKEFGAQDVGAYMVARVGLKHVKVAVWVEGPDLWSLTPEGEELLAPQDASVVESANTSASKDEPVKRGRKLKDDSEGLDL